MRNSAAGVLSQAPAQPSQQREVLFGDLKSGEESFKLGDYGLLGPGLECKLPPEEAVEISLGPSGRDVTPTVCSRLAQSFGERVAVELLAPSRIRVTVQSPAEARDAEAGVGLVALCRRVAALCLDLPDDAQCTPQQRGEARQAMLGMQLRIVTPVPAPPPVGEPGVLMVEDGDIWVPVPEFK